MNPKSIVITVVLLCTYPVIGTCQTAFTVPNARAYATAFNSLTENNLHVNGIMNNGDYYMAGINQHYDASGNAQPLELVKIDITKKTVSYKILKGTVSSSSALWSYVYDSLGNFYLGLNSANRSIYKFNLKDSIWYRNLGNGFGNTGALAYGLQLGQDNHVYFSASSASDGYCHVAEYDPYSDTLYQYPPIDRTENFTLQASGDAGYIYAATGQYGFKVVSMNKITKALKTIFTSNTRTFIGTQNDGVVASADTAGMGLNNTFLLKNGTSYGLYNGSGHNISYSEINGTEQPTVSTYFDKINSVINASVNGSSYFTIPIITTALLSGVRACFLVGNSIYFVGDYYGNYYRYDSATSSSFVLGTSGMNIYSQTPYNDSLTYLGGYPSGQLLLYNKNRAWSVGTFVNGKVVGVSDTSNPQVIVYWRSETPAGFHRVQGLVKDNNGNIVGSGNIINTGATTSIAGYNPLTRKYFGYNYHAIDNLAYSGLAVYNKWVLFSTNNTNGGIPKIYYYNSLTNTMDDSITLSGITDYGRIYLAGNSLIGIAQHYLYKLNLQTKKLIKSYTLTNPVNYSFQLADGRILINISENLPTDIIQFIKVPSYGFSVQKGADVYFANGTCLDRYLNIGFPQTDSTIHEVDDKILTLFPNPSNGVFTIQLNNLSASEISITDINGKNIFHQIIPDFIKKQTITVKLPSVAKGMYFIHIISKEGTSTNKILVE